MKDFSIQIYKELLKELLHNNYEFFTVEEYFQKRGDGILLRHDIDDRKSHALTFAKLQHESGIRGTYYFRMVPQSFDEKLIKQISEMGHEIGYHYEELDITNGDLEKGLILFEKNLAKLRKLVPITTICMHGSPLSAFDNKDLWKKYDYKDYGIIGEPYLDIDFQNLYYLTDTGRSWSDQKYSIRDKIQDSKSKLDFRTTHQIINDIQTKSFPPNVMMNFHPQRWTDDPKLWLEELLRQNIKNILKYGLIKYRELT